MEEKRSSFLTHLAELRKRLIYIFFSLIIPFLIILFFSNKIIFHINNFFIKDLNLKLIAISPLEYVYVTIKVALFISIILSFPIILYNLIKFIKPALKKNEKRYFYFLIPLSIILFFLGILFSIFVFLKILFIFLLKIIPNNIQNLWSINNFISFITLTTITIGIIFQLPILLFLLNRLNIISTTQLKQKRKYIYILIFILAAFITPPDALTLLLLSIPLIILYELSILFLRMFQ